MEFLYRERPFRVRNADEYDLEQVLNLFVSPLEGLATPFDYENNIIKGKMGSGKTMYLRANHAYHLYNMVPSLLDHTELILPVFIRLSDFQHLSEASDIYRSIIIKIIEELSSIYIHLQDADKLASIHKGMKKISHDIVYKHKLSATLNQLLRLGADQYVERVQTKLDLSGTAKPKFIELSAKYSKEQFLEVQKKSNPGIKDVEECYKILLEDRQGKILLLIDEAGVLDKCFFRGDQNDSFFEILMNQFRTASFLRTKIAIYPNSYQDILTETRYGDVIILEESVHDEPGYNRLRKKSKEIIKKYINANGDPVRHKAEELFDISSAGYGDALEQILYASDGNIRRLIQLFDLSLSMAFEDHGGEGKVLIEHTLASLKRQAHETEGFYNPLELEFLSSVAKACRNRSTYRFTFPYMSPILNKYTSRSQEYNLLKVVEVGAGRRKTTYAFDYAYCVLHDIPTHYQKDSEKINRDRSLKDGRWITRVASISEEILKETEKPEKLHGVITYYREGRGFISTTEGNEYFFGTALLIESDHNRRINKGMRVIFLPLAFDDNRFAVGVEIID